MFGVLRTEQHVTALSGQKGNGTVTKVILVWKAGVHIFYNAAVPQWLVIGLP
jgi:hypothetical protein